MVVDFTIAAASRENLPQVGARGVHAVVGTTGFDDADLDALQAAFDRSACLIAPNFAISAVLMMRFAELASPYFDTAEVIELHHDNKIDAPSGTATATLDRMAAASSDWADDPTEHEVIEGARGGEGPAGIRVHSVRMRGMVAHQQVILGDAVTQLHHLRFEAGIQPDAFIPRLAKDHRCPMFQVDGVIFGVILIRGM